MKKKKRVVKKKKKPFRPLSREEYAKALLDPRWQKKRLKIFQRDRWRCRKCGSTKKTLHVHHLKYTRRYPWNEPNENLITYCVDCHRGDHKRW